MPLITSIELAKRRVELGKPAEGVLTLHALYEGGQVTIEIADDGAGIDGERFRKKAVEREAITPSKPPLSLAALTSLPSAPRPAVQMFWGK